MYKRLLKRALPGPVARTLQLSSQIDQLSAKVASLHLLLEEQHQVILSLNHRMLYGGEGGFPLLIDVAQRIRSDADAAIGALMAIDRRLAIFETREYETPDHVGQ